MTRKEWDATRGRDLNAVHMNECVQFMNIHQAIHDNICIF